MTLTALAASAAALVALGALPRLARAREIAATHDVLKSLALRVTVATAREGTPNEVLTLPASLRANASADLFAQATGYVRELRADIGDPVKTGDVLAIVDVPLLDEELNRARATLEEAVAERNVLARNLELARTTLARVKSVTTPGAVSQQMLDERQGAFDAATASLAAGDATIASRRADVQRLERSQAFARLTAPFDGTITARAAEVGDFVQATGGGAPLFRIADTATLRAYVDVPQSFATGVSTGLDARIRLREFPGREFRGAVARTSGALDERARTLRVEIRIPNERGEILAGSYGQVEIDLARAVKGVVVPGSAVLIRAEGARAAVVDGASRLHYVPLRLGRDFGTEVEILEGLTPGDRVVVNMADELPEGSAVEAVPLPSSGAAAARAASSVNTDRERGSHGVSK
jgi:RND family efflux transporter MFP subunit